MYIWTMKLYQQLATRTMKRHPNREVAELYFAGALGGESGEVFELIKKHIRDEVPVDRDRLKKELGDVLWYIAANCQLHGFTLEEVAEANIDKLKEPYPTGRYPTGAYDKEHATRHRDDGG